MKTCRTCIYCSWQGQYCAAKDCDLGRSYMAAPNNCNHYQPNTNENE